MNELMKGIVETIEAVKTTAPAAEAPKTRPPKIGRNEKCPCESGKKYKKCCGGVVVAEPEFKFMDTRDSIGLPLEHATYVKRNCKDCGGRGNVKLLIGEQRERTARPCFCVNKGYVRTRKEAERLIAEEIKYRIDEEVANAAVLRGETLKREDVKIGRAEVWRDVVETNFTDLAPPKDWEPPAIRPEVPADEAAVPHVQD